MISRVFLLIALVVSSTILAGEVAVAQISMDESSYSAESKLERTKQLINAPQSSTDTNWHTVPEVSLGGSLTKSLQGLGICIGIFLLGMHFYRKFNPHVPRQHGKAMRIVERMSISSKSSLVLADVNGQKILFAVGTDRVTQVDMLAQEERQIIDLPLEHICQEDLKVSAA